MVAIEVKHLRCVEDKQQVLATIISNSVPTELPTTGEGIVGMSEKQIFAPMSMLIVPDAGNVYMADEDGVFREWGGGNG